MKKRVAIFILVMVFVLSLPAYAATSRAVTINPKITFSGTTATCTVVIAGDDSEDDITAVVKLWDGSSCLATWNVDGLVYVHMVETKTVTKGKGYTLTVDAIIDGVTYPQASAYGTCK